MTALRDDELTQALLPTVADLVVAVHDHDEAAVAAAFATAERLAGGPLVGAQALAILAAGMARGGGHDDRRPGLDAGPPAVRDPPGWRDAVAGGVPAVCAVRCAVRFLHFCAEGCYFVKDRFVWRCCKCGKIR